MGTWKTVNLEGFQSVFYIMQYKNAYLGAWIDLNQLEEKMGMTESAGENVMAFCDAQGSVCVPQKEGLDQINLNERYQRYDGILHTLVSADSQYADLYLVQMLSKNEITNGRPAAIRLFQVLSILSLLVLPMILVAMRRWMLIPLGKLSAAMGKIEHGDMEFRIDETYTGSEFDAINRNFNHMMDEVSRLKIDVYEEQIKGRDIQMRFLAQQIQPHFILNTLSILHSYEQEDYPLIQKMILCLSRYFRHIVNAKDDFVELKQEMEHIQNYFEIQKARYPRIFFAVVEYDQEIENCLIPPLLIQNFAENAIKHSLQLDNKIDIFVIAQQRGSGKIRIRMADTGAGIEQSILEEIEKFQKTGKYQKGLGIGIQNAIERLHILYKGDASLEIFRANPHGTQVEITIPLRRKEEDDAECDFD